MPGNLFAIVFSWLATHLVAVTLSLFVLVGWQVFSLESTSPAVQSDLAGQPLDSTSMGAPLSAPREVPAPKPAMPSRPRETPPTEPVAGVLAPQPAAHPSRPPPKLIGGSLPIYDTAPGGSGSMAPTADGFRPPVDDAATMPSVPPGSEPDHATAVQAARRAFWNGDFEAAEIAYMGLIARFPDDPDSFGELGNLYQAMGRNAEALDAFFEAGVRLKGGKDLEKLNHVKDLLEREGDPRATQLLP